jgi:hypothetical protein
LQPIRAVRKPPKVNRPQRLTTRGCRGSARHGNAPLGWGGRGRRALGEERGRGLPDVLNETLLCRKREVRPLILEHIPAAQCRPTRAAIVRCAPHVTTARTQTHTGAHTHVHARTHSQARARAQMPAHTCTRTHRRAHTCARSRTHAHAVAAARARTLSDTDMHH